MALDDQLKAMLTKGTGESHLHFGQRLFSPSNRLWQSFYTTYDQAGAEAAGIIGAHSTGLREDEILGRIGNYLDRLDVIKDGTRTGQKDYRQLLEHQQHNPKDILTQIARNGGHTYEEYIRTLKREGLWTFIHAYNPAMKNQEEQALIKALMTPVLDAVGEQKDIFAGSLKRAGGFAVNNGEIASNLDAYLARYLLQYRDALPR